MEIKGRKALEEKLQQAEKMLKRIKATRKTAYGAYVYYDPFEDALIIDEEPFYEYDMVSKEGG